MGPWVTVPEQVAAPLMDAVPVRAKRKAHFEVEVFGERRPKEPKPAAPAPPPAPQAEGGDLTEEMRRFTPAEVECFEELKCHAPNYSIIR